MQASKQMPKYKKGSFTVVPAKETLRSMDPHAQCLFRWICDYADDDGRCFPSNARLAEDSGMSASTVKRKKKLLIEAGLLETTERKRDDGSKTSDGLQILLPDHADGGMGQSELGGGVRVNHAHGSERPNINSTHNELKSNEVISDQILDNWFAMFWDEYPRKVGKKKARSKFETAIGDPDSEQEAKELFTDIINGLRSQKKTSHWQDSDMKYLPHPTTWLNQGRWEDDPDAYNYSDEKQDTGLEVANY